MLYCPLLYFNMCTLPLKRCQWLKKEVFFFLVLLHFSVYEEMDLEDVMWFVA